MSMTYRLTSPLATGRGINRRKLLRKPANSVTAPLPDRQPCMPNRFNRLVMVLIAVTACAAPPEVSKPRSQMSQRERDSALAESGLPGSQVVRKAMNMSDAQNKRAAAYDSASQQN